MAERDPERSHRTERYVTGGDKRPIYLGDTGDFPLNEMRTFNIDRKRIAVVRTTTGLFAMIDRCPHQGAALSGGRVGGTMLPGTRPNEYVYGLEGDVVRCPWHGHEFQLSSGSAVGGVTRGRLACFEVKEQDGGVYFTGARIGQHPDSPPGATARPQSNGS